MVVVLGVTVAEASAATTLQVLKTIELVLAASTWAPTVLCKKASAKRVVVFIFS